MSRRIGGIRKASFLPTNTFAEATNQTATARVELENWTGHRFTDMFTQLKTNGEWKIISKVFHMHE